LQQVEMAEGGKLPCESPIWDKWIRPPHEGELALDDAPAAAQVL